MKRWEFINRYIKRFDNPRYLEIGVRDGANFNRINAGYKVGVDPDRRSKATVFKTSDEYFKDCDQEFDFIFIDGLHHSEQVYRDIKNSLNHLSAKGIIMLHDCNPSLEIDSLVPQQTSHWNGDVYKAWIKFRSETDLLTYTIDDDEGLGVIHNGEEGKPVEVREELTWKYFDYHKRYLLNLVSVYDWEMSESALV